MNELQKELDAVWKMITSIPVSGDSVELMASAKEHLRKAFNMAKKNIPSYETVEENEDE